MDKRGTSKALLMTILFTTFAIIKLIVSNHKINQQLNTLFMKKLLLTTLSFGILIAITFGQQVENPGFEDWEDAGTVIDEPVNWSSIKTSDAGDVINGFAPVVWEQSDDAHTGNYSVELFNVQTLLLATGTLVNGRIHASLTPGESGSYTDPTDSRWHTAFTARPDSLALWIKYWPMGTDTAQTKVILHVGEGSLPPTPENQGNWVGYAEINVAETIEEWTRVVAPFTYFSEGNPEYMLVNLTAGAGFFPVEGSIVRYDDLELIYNPNSISDVNTNSALIYTYGMTIHLEKFDKNQLNGAHLELINMNGVSIWSTGVSSSQINLDGKGISQGLYVVKITTKNSVYAKKVQLK